MRRSAIVRTGIAVGIALLPVIAAIGFSKSLFDASLHTTLPLLNDEVAYWNQVATFAATGFNGGYITVDERPSRVSWSHFGPHGPAFALLYGLPAKVFGWGYTSGPVFGATAFVLGALLFILLTRPPPLLVAALLASFWPLVVALPTTMQEPLHFAIGCGLAVLLRRVLTDEDGSTPMRSLLAVALALGAASLVRPVWALLAIPFGWYAGRRWGRGAGLVGAGAGVAFAALCYAAFMTLAAPYIDRGSPQLADVMSAPEEALRKTFRRATVESPRDWLFEEAYPLERVVRAELLAVGVLTCLLSIRRSTPRSVKQVDRFVAATVAVLLAALFAMGTIGGWQDFRSTSPLLLTMLLLSISAHPRLIWVFVAGQVVAAPAAISGFKQVHHDRFQLARRDAVDEFASNIRQQIAYDPALSPWGNTVLVHADQYKAPLMALPPGVGASAVVYWDNVNLPLRSRYVLLSPAESANVGTRARLRKLADTPIGLLFENLDWQR
jgi:hypothetical protein